MKLKSKIRFANKKVKKEFYQLQNGTHEDQELFFQINKTLVVLETNVFSGVQIPKKLIPEIYIKKYEITNVWKYNLPCGWRLIYSIVKDEIIVSGLVIEWFDPKSYERRFKY